MASSPDEGFYAEWLDSYFARDVQELFQVEKRTGFLRLLEMLLRQSGGLMEATSLARATALSRPTVLNYLEIFNLTHVIHLLRPYHGGGNEKSSFSQKSTVLTQVLCVLQKNGGRFGRRIAVSCGNIWFWILS